MLMDKLMMRVYSLIWVCLKVFNEIANFNRNYNGLLDSIKPY